MIVLKATQDKVLRFCSRSPASWSAGTPAHPGQRADPQDGQCVQLTTSDLEIQIRTTAELGGDTALHHHGGRAQADRHPAHHAGRPDGEPGIGPVQAHLKGGKSRFTLQTLPAEDFPLVQEAAASAPCSACRKRR
jgi:DNA polymerase-3 subunit beta